MEPVRPCCGQRHAGIRCPDGLVMCCICLRRIPVDHLAGDLDGIRRDVCDTCTIVEGCLTPEGRAVIAHELRGMGYTVEEP